MRPELAKRDDVWRCRRRHVLAAGKNRHALVGRSSMRRRNPEEMTIKESSPGSVSCARIMLRDRSQGQEVISVTGRWLLLTLLSVTNTVCPRLDIGTQVCAHRTQAQVRQSVARPLLASSSLRRTRALHAGKCGHAMQGPLAKPAIRRCRFRVDG